MNDRTLPRLVLALVLVAFALYAVADGNVLVLVAGMPLAVLGWWNSLSRERAMAKWLLTALVVVAILNAWKGVLRDGLDVTDFCEFVVLIQLIKLFDRRSARDYAQLITLSTFLAIGAVLTSADFLAGLILLAFLPLLVLTAMRHQFYAGREQELDHARALGVEPALLPDRARGIWALLALSLASGLVISIPVFLLMPRGLGADTFGTWTRVVSGSRTGFSDTIRLGGAGLINESHKIVLDISIKDLDGAAVGGPNEVFYLRGAVLSRYENGTWVRGDHATKRMKAEPGDAMPFGRGNGEVVDLVQTITLRNMPADRAYLFGAWKPVLVSFQQPGNIFYDPSTRTFLRSGDPGKFQYSVQSVRQVRIPDTNFPRVNGPVSFPSESIRSQARGVLNSVGIDPDALTVENNMLALAARTIENHLRTDYKYSLEMRRPRDGTDPIEWFLQESKTGHCEYFASAMTAMCRSVGIGARVVTGYVAAEWVPESQHYVVRESNAHAWVEIEVKPNIWRTYDPTPPGDLIANHKPKHSLMARISQMIEALEYVWIRSVVGFDEQTRLSLIGGDRFDPMSTTRDEAQSSTPALLLNRRSIGSALSNGAVAFSITMGVGLLTLLTLRLARGRSSVEGWGGDDGEVCRAQAQFFERLMRELRRLGVPRPATTPPLKHVCTALSDPALAPARRLSEAYYELRFGARPLSDERMDQVRADLERLSRVARRRSENE